MIKDFTFNHKKKTQKLLSLSLEILDEILNELKIFTVMNDPAILWNDGYSPLLLNYLGKVDSKDKIIKLYKRIERIRVKLKTGFFIVMILPRSKKNVAFWFSGIIFLRINLFEIEQVYGLLPECVDFYKASTIYHELLHRYYIDEKFKGEIVNSEYRSVKLAQVDPIRAKRNPANWEWLGIRLIEKKKRS